MRIDINLGINGTSSPDSVNGANSSQARKPVQSSSQDNADQANLSADAQQLSDLSGILSNTPQVRQNRVAAIAQALQNGTYAVSNQQIAQSMLRDFRGSNASGWSG